MQNPPITRFRRVELPFYGSFVGTKASIVVCQSAGERDWIEYGVLLFFNNRVLTEKEINCMFGETDGGSTNLESLSTALGDDTDKKYEFDNFVEANTKCLEVNTNFSISNDGTVLAAIISTSRHEQFLCECQV